VNDARWILVVDDDEDIRDMIVLSLGLEGYEAVGACDGQEALERIRERGRPGVIFLDLRMPRMSGPDFVHALHDDPAIARTPIVVLSGDATAVDAAATLGALDCLIKPIDLAVLVGAAARALRPEG
jgi:CheY-like chemotaxis protein